MTKFSLLTLVLLTSALSAGNAASKDLIISADVSIRGVEVETGKGEIEYGRCTLRDWQSFRSGPMSPGQTKTFNLPMVAGAACYRVWFSIDTKITEGGTGGCQDALKIVNGRFVSTFVSDSDPSGRATLRVTRNTLAYCEGEMIDNSGG